MTVVRLKRDLRHGGVDDHAPRYPGFIRDMCLSLFALSGQRFGIGTVRDVRFLQQFRRHLQDMAADFRELFLAPGIDQGRAPAPAR